MVVKYKDTITGIVLMLFSIITYFATYSIKDLGLTSVSAKFFPAMCSVAVFLLSLVLIYQNVKKNKNIKCSAVNINMTKNIKGIKNVLLSLGILFISMIRVSKALNKY